VLVDVGIAVRRGSEKNPAGTPGFTAPEVFGDGGESPATDVYSLGALAYALLTLRAPFGEASPLELLSMQSSQRPASLAEIRPDLPRELDAVLLPALDPDPSLRPQSATALVKALAEVLAEPGDGERRRKPRITIEPPAMPPQAPRISIRSSASIRIPATLVPSSRGVLFRSAYEVLGARRGNSWLSQISRRLPELGQALAQGALAWHPTISFISVLQSLAHDERDRHALVMQLGRTAIDASFREFYGADPSVVSPAHVLRAAENYWSCYHTWGQATVHARQTEAEVIVTDGIPHAILCASTAGLLAGVVAHAGGRAVSVEHRACLAEHATECVFHVRWASAT
jgi:hypothetical protein